MHLPATSHGRLPRLHKAHPPADLGRLQRELGHARRQVRQRELLEPHQRELPKPVHVLRRPLGQCDAGQLGMQAAVVSLHVQAVQAGGQHAKPGCRAAVRGSSKITCAREGGTP